MHKKSYWIATVVVLCIALIGVAVYFGNTNAQKGALMMSPRVSSPTCASTWTKVFEGNVTGTKQINNNWWLMNPSLSLTLSDANALKNDGCSFKFVQYEAAGGGSGSKSFDCVGIGISDNDGTFYCYVPMTSPSSQLKDAYYEGVSIVLPVQKSGQTYYNTLQYDPPLNTKVMVFAKK